MSNVLQAELEASQARVARLRNVVGIADIAAREYGASNSRLSHREVAAMEALGLALDTLPPGDLTTPTGARE